MWTQPFVLGYYPYPDKKTDPHWKTGTMSCRRCKIEGEHIGYFYFAFNDGRQIEFCKKCYQELEKIKTFDSELISPPQSVMTRMMEYFTDDELQDAMLQFPLLEERSAAAQAWEQREKVSVSEGV